MGSNYSRMVIKCIIDDDPQKWGRYIQGIKVLGGRDKIVEYASFYNIDEIFNEISRHIFNKIESGIIEPNSVISSFAKEMKKVNKLNEENNNGDRCGGYAGC